MNKKTISYYEQDAARVAVRYEAAQVEDLHRRLLSCFKGASTLLELGAGSGREAAFMVSRGYAVTGIDASPAMITQAETLHPELRGKVRYLELPCTLPFEDMSFDGVYSIATLMHLSAEDAGRVLSEAARVVKPSGRLFLSVCLDRSDLDAAGCDPSGRFFSRLTRQEWLAMCEQIGFGIVEQTDLKDGIGRQEMNWFTVAAEKNRG